jgi:hypothetical protein
VAHHWPSNELGENTKLLSILQMVFHVGGKVVRAMFVIQTGKGIKVSKHFELLTM